MLATLSIKWGIKPLVEKEKNHRQLQVVVDLDFKPATLGSFKRRSWLQNEISRVEESEAENSKRRSALTNLGRICEAAKARRVPGDLLVSHDGSGFRHVGKQLGRRRRGGTVATPESPDRVVRHFRRKNNHFWVRDFSKSIWPRIEI